MSMTGLGHICTATSGTHLCQFYQTEQDLLEIQVPYFRRGLQDNARCIWMVCNPLDTARAKAALRVAMPDLDRYLSSGQIEILDGHEYYSKTIRLDDERFSQFWITLQDAARAGGYAGLRVGGNGVITPDLDRWKAFLNYERMMDPLFRELQIMALCSYGLPSPHPGRFMDVFAQHEIALIRQDGMWQAIKNHEYERTSVAQDKDKQRSLLDAERAARVKAEHLNRAKDEFLATVSHELRSPLAGILGWTRLVKRGANAQEIKHGMEVVEQNAAALAHLVDDLLDVSRIISGKIRLQMSVVEPETFIRTVVDSLQLAANNKNLNLEQQLPFGLRCIRCDPNRMRQVLWNLLTNAIKFTPAGGRIRVSARQDDSCLIIQVSDTGEGISPASLPCIFDKFQQADNTAMRQHGGLGLGLAIIKHIIELHGGEIEAASEGPGKGSNFTVRLPFASAKSADDRAADCGDTVNGDDMLPDSLVVLMVDDDLEACELIGRVLKESGAYVLTTHSVAEARTILSHCKPDIVISDISMPDEDGYGLIHHIRSPDSRCADLPCIALSSLTRPEDHEQALTEGFDEHLSKLTEPLDLVRTIRTVLRKKGHSRADEKSRQIDGPSPEKIASRKLPAHILVAEDDPATSEMLKMTLELVGYRVSVAESIQSALALVADSPIDVLLADLRLKDGTGMDLMARLRENHQVSGIMMSGYSDDIYKLKSRTAGFDEYLVKPIDTDKLCELLATIAPPFPPSN